jgi:hypothetical protein
MVSRGMHKKLAVNDKSEGWKRHSVGGGPKYIHNNKLCAKNTPMGRDNPSKTSVISRVLRAARWWTLGGKNCTIKGREGWMRLQRASRPPAPKKVAAKLSRSVFFGAVLCLRNRKGGRLEKWSFVCCWLHFIEKPLLARTRMHFHYGLVESNISSRALQIFDLFRWQRQKYSFFAQRLWGCQIFGCNFLILRLTIEICCLKACILWVIKYLIFLSKPFVLNK